MPVWRSRTGVQASENERYHVRGIEFTAMALDKSQMALQLGRPRPVHPGHEDDVRRSRRIADRRLKQVLQAMTRNRVLALVVGAILTAVVQSSSATTVMTVGFVNGPDDSQQAIGVVFEPTSAPR